MRRRFGNQSTDIGRVAAASPPASINWTRVLWGGDNETLLALVNVRSHHSAMLRPGLLTVTRPLKCHSLNYYKNFLINLHFIIIWILNLSMFKVCIYLSNITFNIYLIYNYRTEELFLPSRQFLKVFYGL